MNTQRKEGELDLATYEFIRTFNDFKRAAKKLMAIMDRIAGKEYQKPKSLSRRTQESHEFLIQVMDESGRIVEKCFGIRCVADKEKEQK